MQEEQSYGSAFRSESKENRVKITGGFSQMGREDMEHKMDLNDELVRNKAATYFFKMKGDAMREAGIFDGDILIVDRSIRLAEGKVIVAVLNGELLVRRFHKNFSSAFLIPENNRFKPINLAEFSDFMVWGVVVYTIHPL
jgi:DNA polymerase V